MACDGICCPCCAALASEKAAHEGTKKERDEYCEIAHEEDQKRQKAEKERDEARANLTAAYQVHREQCDRLQSEMDQRMTVVRQERDEALASVGVLVENITGRMREFQAEEATIPEFLANLPAAARAHLAEVEAMRRVVEAAQRLFNSKMGWERSGQWSELEAELFTALRAMPALVQAVRKGGAR